MTELTDWLMYMFGDWNLFPLQIALRLRLRIEVDTHDGTETARQIVAAASGNPELFLDVIDAILGLGPDDPDQPVLPENIATLEFILREGGSAWQVSPDGRALTERMSGTVTEAAASVMASASEKAGQHLAAAWRAAYGRHPDPPKAYTEAVLAVEAAAGHLVLPSDSSATLGKMNAHIRDTIDIWHIGISRPDDGTPEAAPLLAMMKLLWEGQTGRHGSGKRSEQVTPQAAEMAVHLAVTLVQWLTSGYVHCDRR